MTSEPSQTIQFVVSVMLTQVYLSFVSTCKAACKDDVAPLCQHLLKQLESRQPDGQVCKHTLPVLTKLVNNIPDILTEGRQQSRKEFLSLFF